MTSGDGSVQHIVTVLPARNEAASVAACIASLHRARAALPTSVTSSLVVVADSCSDGTAERALAAIDPARDLVVCTNAGTAGGARRAGTTLALQTSPADLAHTWICATDADSTVTSDWYTTHLDAARRGFVALAGIVRLAEDTDPPVLREFARTYLTHTDGTHPHVHGTNLGFRADAYVAVGGWSELPTAEDHDLWRRLDLIGVTLSSVQLVVTTSGRTIGRAPDGFAATLATLVGAKGSAA